MPVSSPSRLPRVSAVVPIGAILLATLIGCSEPPPVQTVNVVIGPSARIGGVLIERAALVIEGDRLIAAGAQGNVPIPAGSMKLDLSSKHLVDVPEVGGVATFTVLVCNPEGEPSCASKVFKHMKAGKWLD
jgi:hypothetical protein